ncbi:glycoside hydrolase superfamily [Clohesyomyces aquaticus]|uniref:alpha-galactosidase n=1 Tax=Clohesyomyces aquaticus TaxID=1231657 RepID=A0A1Y1YQF0_9PLEO|nr:glycoside hydrolase superfamily [Clohesyomyces aquaticus]
MLSCLLSVWLFASSTLAQTAMFTRGQKFQIILTGVPDTSKNPLPPTDAPVFDVDLFNTDAGTIDALKAQGKTVICYFSAGSLENWRTDAKDFPASDQGKVLDGWPDEKWIRTGSAKIRDIMSKRIKMAADKGCDAIDPDNTDGYQNDNGLNLQQADLIDYMRFLQRTAAGYNMQIGLKNSIDILGTLSSIMDFAVNEECAKNAECSRYNAFLNSNKPVFHIEYPSKMNPVPNNDKNNYCSGAGTSGMSTVLKNISLDGLVIYCDGSQVDTPTRGNGPSRPPKSTSKPGTRSSTTRRFPSSSSSHRTSSSRSAVTSSTMITIPSTTTEEPPSSPPSSSPSEESPTPTPITTPSSTSTSTTSSSTQRSSTPRPSSSRTSSQRPVSTPANPGGGCKQKHWDQCGGQDWKGCTVCESPYQCKGVSPPYYYQCL